MSANNGIFILETIGQTGSEYRIIATHEFDGLYFSYVEDDIHSESLPTRLIEYFKKCKPITNKLDIYGLAYQMLKDNYYEYGITTIHKDQSWSSLIIDAKNYAKKEIQAIIERQDRNEIGFISELEKILSM